MNVAKRTYDPQKHTIFKPINEEKYADRDPIICKSQWERDFCVWCDNNHNILKWSSETLQIPYYDPIQRKNRRYFPDFMMVVKDVNENLTKWVVEIKPYAETIQPIRGRKKEKTFMYQFATFQTNVAKWKAAEMFCRKHGLVFKLLTEKDLYRGK
jgi:hypothetical protein